MSHFQSIYISENFPKDRVISNSHPLLISVGHNHFYVNNHPHPPSFPLISSFSPTSTINSCSLPSRLIFTHLMPPLALTLPLPLHPFAQWRLVLWQAPTLLAQLTLTPTSFPLSPFCPVGVGLPYFYSPFLHSQHSTPSSFCPVEIGPLADLASFSLQH